MRASAMAPSASRRSQAPAPAMAMSISRRGVKRRYVAGRARRDRRQQDRDQHFARRERRAAGPRETSPRPASRACRRGPAITACAPWQISAGTAVRRRRRIADVAAEARPVLHLHAADELRRLGDGRVAGRDGRMPRDGRCRRRGADRHAAVGQHRDRRQLGDVLQVDDARGPPPPLAQLRHQVGAAGQRARIGRAHGRDGLLDGFGPLIDEVLQLTAPP